LRRRRWCGSVRRGVSSGGGVISYRIGAIEADLPLIRWPEMNDEKPAGSQ